MTEIQMMHAIMKVLSYTSNNTQRKNPLDKREKKKFIKVFYILFPNKKSSV